MLMVWEGSREEVEIEEGQNPVGLKKGIINEGSNNDSE